MDKPFEYFGATLVPSERDCEWCRDDPPRKAAHLFEIHRRGKLHTGLFVAACHQHREIAEISADPRKAKDAA